MAKTKLFKTSIVIWSDYDPTGMDLEDLARDAVSGLSICTKMERVPVDDPQADPDWDGNEFFNLAEFYEVTRTGFDGATDATDDKIWWIKAPSRDALDLWAATQSDIAQIEELDEHDPQMSGFDLELDSAGCVVHNYREEAAALEAAQARQEIVPQQYLVIGTFTIDGRTRTHECEITTMTEQDAREAFCDAQAELVASASNVELFVSTLESEESDDL